MKHRVLVWLARLMLRFIDWAEPKRKPVLPPPPLPRIVAVNVELLNQLYKADFIFGFAFGEQPSWLAKQMHSTHLS